jgi:hypothetical protein
MAGAGPEGLTVRYQFRLDLRDPLQGELARRLNELPGGQRNRFIVERLTAPEAGADVAGIKDALREVLLEFSPALSNPPAVAAPTVPDELFDVNLFQ